MAPADLAALLDEVEARLGAGELEEARVLAEDLCRRFPDDPDAHYLRADSLLSLGRPREAEQAFRRANALLPEDPLIFSGLGLALYDQARLDEAEELLIRALALDDRLAEAHWVLAGLLERRGQTGQATRHAKRAVHLDRKGFHLPVRMSRESFDACVADALAELPEAVRQAARNTPVLIEPFPAEHDLRAADPPLSPDLLGLYRGPMLTERSSFDAWTQLPGEIVLYQGNLQRACRTRAELVREIRTTVLHEVGHLLGLDEDDLDDRGLA